MTPGAAVVQINRLLSPLVGAGLVVDSIFAHERQTGSGLSEVTFRNAEHLAEALRSRSYHDLYGAVAGRRAYNAMLDDGALIQMSYLFEGRSLKRHRLAYMGAPGPAPADESGAADDGVMATDGPPTVFRFDYDDQDHPNGVTHPKSHLTIGRNEHCRIPVSHPVTPSQFLDFVLRHFYPSDLVELPSFTDNFPPCLSREAHDLAHVTIPVPNP